MLCLGAEGVFEAVACRTGPTQMAKTRHDGRRNALRGRRVRMEPELQTLAIKTVHTHVS